MYRVLRSLVATLLLGLMLGAPLVQAVQAQDKSQIYMVVWRGCEEACQAFRDFFDERGLPIEVRVIDVDRDPDLLVGVRETILAERPDMVVTWGTSVSVGLLGTRAEYGLSTALGDIPALFMIVADPVRSDLVESYERSGRAMVTGVQNRVPEATQMQLIRSYMDLSHVGVINNPMELNSQINTDTLRMLGEEQKFKVTAVDYGLMPDGTPDVGQIPMLMDRLKAGGAEAVYVGSSSVNLANRDAFTTAAVARGLPVFTAYAQMVQDSQALMAVANAYANVGRLAAAQAVKVLEQGITPGDLPIASLDRFSVFLNMGVARDLGLYPPIQLINIAEIVGGQERQ
jgi:putative tryptophan/tyrosine transport system substrate-binding protein